MARSCSPDLILAPSAADAHQDHRTIGEIVPTVFRDLLYLAYEIPKWDGDLGRPSVYVPLSADLARRKVELLHKCFPSQHGRDWWDDEVFLGLARLRGMECRARVRRGVHAARRSLLSADGLKSTRHHLKREGTSMTIFVDLDRTSRPSCARPSTTETWWS